MKENLRDLNFSDPIKNFELVKLGAQYYKRNNNAFKSTTKILLDMGFIKDEGDISKFDKKNEKRFYELMAICIEWAEEEEYYLALKVKEIHYEPENCLEFLSPDWVFVCEDGQLHVFEATTVVFSFQKELNDFLAKRLKDLYQDGYYRFYVKPLNLKNAENPLPERFNVADCWRFLFHYPLLEKAPSERLLEISRAFLKDERKIKEFLKLKGDFFRKFSKLINRFQKKLPLLLGSVKEISGAI